MPANDVDRLARMFRALSNPNRLRLLLNLLDESKLDLTKKGVKRTDKDWAVAWLKTYGKGRVFYTTIGHTLEVYERPDVQKMYLEAIKWALGMTNADVTPHPMPTATR